MAFATKQDYSGLTTIAGLTNALVVRDAAVNTTQEKYQPQGQDGSFLATEVFGEDSAPTNNFGVKGGITLTSGAIKLNKVTTVDNKPYALESIEITTAAGSAPTISATSQEIETGATDANQCHYSVPALTLTTKHHAQILFGAFSAFASGCSLTACSASIAGSINKDKVEGVKVSSDINSGVITVTGTVLQTGDTAPVLTATTADGWVITGPLNCTNPESAYKSYSFELQKVLAKDTPTQQANG